MKLFRLVWQTGLSLAPVAAVLLAGVIAILSLMPGSHSGGFEYSDKLNHFIAYATLAAVCVAATKGRWLFLIAIGLVVYGLALEAGQMVLPFSRDSSWLDALANAAGTALGVMLGRVGLVAGNWVDQSFAGD